MIDAQLEAFNFWHNAILVVTMKGLLKIQPLKGSLLEEWMEATSCQVAMAFTNSLMYTINN